MSEGSVFWRIIAGLFFLFLGGIILYNVASADRRREILVGGRLFECATHVWKSKWILAGYIGAFIIAFAFLIFLVAFELLAIWSAGTLVFNPQSPYYEVKGFMANVLSFFIFFQFIWAMSFLKEAFNFCVSGYATNWYYFSERDK